MKVKELIKWLETQESDADVYVWDDEWVEWRSVDLNGDPQDYRIYCSKDDPNTGLLSK